MTNAIKALWNEANETDNMTMANVYATAYMAMTNEGTIYATDNNVQMVAKSGILYTTKRNGSKFSAFVANITEDGIFYGQQIAEGTTPKSALVNANAFEITIKLVHGKLMTTVISSSDRETYYTI